MKFSGELKFPEIDHPGVPVSFLIEGSQAELIVEGESLGRWSLYDIHARRLVASAFQIDLDGTEVTFVADDPVDFAYRGVEHMAETWATLKSKRIASRTIAVRKSRKGTIPSRIEDMKSAMMSNLEDQSAPRQIAGEEAMPEPAGESATPTDLPAASPTGDWDRRDQSASIPVVGSEAEESQEPEPPAQPAAPGPRPAEPTRPADDDVTEDKRRLEEERRRLAEERARLEEERRLAEQREADRIEAYRLEMKRLEAEREALRRQAAAAGESAAPDLSEELEEVPGPEAEPELASEREFASEPEDRSPQPEPEREPEPEPQLEREPEPELEREPEPEPEREPELEPEPEPERELEPQPEPEEGQESEGQERMGVLDLKDLEEDAPSPEETGPAPTRPAASSRSELPSPHSAPRQDPEPAIAGAPKDKSGLMGAVRAAFKTSPRDHQHQFIEAPGGIGITRYVCEECGYVSISV